jgi:hypothetical protein
MVPLRYAQSVVDQVCASVRPVTAVGAKRFLNAAAVLWPVEVAPPTSAPMVRFVDVEQAAIEAKSHAELVGILLKLRPNASAAAPPTSNQLRDAAQAVADAWDEAHRGQNDIAGHLAAHRHEDGNLHTPIEDLRDALAAAATPGPTEDACPNCGAFAGEPCVEFPGGSVGPCDARSVPAAATPGIVIDRETANAARAALRYVVVDTGGGDHDDRTALARLDAALADTQETTP